ncbi:MAG: hypothetical protein L6306_07490 [Planctomycetales bacterium]|nr:hypothetical protein [Planctomycetales bacterium]
MILVELPFAGSKSLHELPHCGGHLGVVGRLMRRSSAEGDPLAPPPAALAPEVPANLALGHSPQEGDQPGPSPGIVAGKKLAVVFDQVVPDPGGDLIDQVRVGVIGAQHDLDRDQQRPMALGIKLFPGGRLARQTSLGQA